MGGSHDDSYRTGKWGLFAAAGQLSELHDSYRSAAQNMQLVPKMMRLIIAPRLFPSHNGQRKQPINGLIVIIALDKFKSALLPNLLLISVYSASESGLADRLIE